MGKITVYKSENRQMPAQEGRIGMYIFSIAFDNGDVGQCGAKKLEGSYTVGDKVTYEIKETKNGGHWVSGIKRVDETGKPMASTYNDPVSIHRSAMGLGLKCGNLFFVQIMKEPKNVKQLSAQAFLFYKWIILGQESENNKDIVYQRGSVIVEAINSLQFPSMEKPEAEKQSDIIIAIANEIWETLFLKLNKETLNAEPPKSQ